MGESPPMLPPCIDPVVIIPAFNHAATLADVARGVMAIGVRLIIVNDGSTDQTPRVTAALCHDYPGRVCVIDHGANRGKAAALFTGFAQARRLGATHAVTIDADGQLEPADIPAMLQAAAARPDALVLGNRPAETTLCPDRCLLGRRWANIGIKAQTGLMFADTQCGLRVYPLDLVERVRCIGRGFAFEGEIITRAAWACRPVVEVPVSCRYFPPAQRVSHFRPWRDSLLQGAVHGLLLLLALCPWRRCGVPSVRGRVHAPWWRRLWDWVNPVAAWREARSQEIGRLEVASALAIGAFVGCTPFFGLHAAICLYVAWRLHLRPAPMVLGSQVSLPPLGVALGFASVWVGYIVLRGRAMAPWGPGGVDWLARPQGAWGIAWGAWGVAWEVLPAWIIGGSVVGLLVGTAAFFAGLLICPRARVAPPPPVAVVA